MGFPNSLQGQPAHEALLGRQDAEIKLLEIMRRTLLAKIKSDRDYASNLISLTMPARRIDKSDELAGSLITQSWRDLMESIEQIGKLVRQQADSMENIVVEQITILYSDRRRARKLYQEEHTWLNNQFQQLSDDVTRKKSEYFKNLESYKLMRSRFEEHYVKSGRGGRKLDEVREKYQKACRKLHLTHNEYVLLLCAVSECELDLRTCYLPSLLERQQIIHEEFIVSWKNIMQDFVKYADFTNEKFLDVHNRMQNAVDNIKPADEYKDFIEKHRSSPLSPVTFGFDDNLVDDTSGKLLPNKLTVDNLTIDWLRSRLSELETSIKVTQSHRLVIQSNMEKNCDKKSYINYAQKQEDMRLQCQEKKFQRQLEVIRGALNELGCGEVPAGCDLSMEGSFSESSKPSSPQATTTNDEKESGNSSLAEEEWFHGVLPREEVVRLLVNNGDFLVRETTRNDESRIVLSVGWDGHKHFIVQITQEGYFRFEGPAFPTIPELIAHQLKCGLPVTSRSGAILKTPITREIWELNNDDVVLLDKIGKGNFGDVYRALLKNKTEVAVKTCKLTLPDEQKRKFLQEGRILKQYNHPNIVKLIGICVQKQPIMIVMELVSGGSLLAYLRNNRATMTQLQLLQMSRDAAGGMSYLELKRCIHRDLAARNCLISHESTVKISDFGMSREEQEYIVSDGMKQIPIKWTAPEALNFGKYTSLCDVWSYGILMWEIFSRGGYPYSGLSNSQAREKIDSGYRMPPPDDTPDDIYKLMLQCWEYEPEKRPHFDLIFSIIDRVIKLHVLAQRKL